MEGGVKRARGLVVLAREKSTTLTNFKFNSMANAMKTSEIGDLHIARILKFRIDFFTKRLWQTIKTRLRNSFIINSATKPKRVGFYSELTEKAFLRKNGR
jgi:hypothetical protein